MYVCIDTHMHACDYFKLLICYFQIQFFPSLPRPWLLLTSYFTSLYFGVGLQRVGHDWATDLIWSLNYLLQIYVILLLLSFNLPTSIICGWFTTFTISAFISEIFLFIINVFLVVAFSFSLKEVALTFLVKLVWWFYLSIKLLISPSNLNKSLTI